MKLFHSLQIATSDHAPSSCCTVPISDAEKEEIDNCLLNSSTLSDNEKSVCFYVAGFLARHGNFPSNDDISLPEDISEWLFQFVLNCYCFFDSVDPRCILFLKRTFILIAHFMFIDESVEDISLILAKVLCKGLMKRTADELSNANNCCVRKTQKFN